MYEPSSERVSDEYADDPYSRLIQQLHVGTYEFLTTEVGNARALDLGCGIGYGTGILAKNGATVVGADVSDEAIAEATKKNRARGVLFIRIGDLNRATLPFDDATFDYVVSLQVIEHIESVENYLREIRRILKPGGTTILTTPNRKKRLYRFQKPWNRFHVREYDDSGLREELAPYFEQVEVSYLRVRKESIKMELYRARMLRLYTLPFTLFVVPDRLRVWILNHLSAFAEKSRHRKLVPRPRCFQRVGGEKLRFVPEDSASAVHLMATCIKKDPNP